MHNHIFNRNPIDMISQTSKYLIIWIFFISFTRNIQAQEQFAEGITYALIVGISDYKNGQIPDLQVAHRDNNLFVVYLLSNFNCILSID